MKKVGIITFSCYSSLGNKIQNYALLHALTQLGCQVDTLFNDDGAYLNPSEKLIGFSKKYLNEVHINFNDTEEVAHLDDRYDAFIVGSDQVWNCSFAVVAKYLSVFFLQFAQPQKRLSYAASFGIGEIPEIFQIPYIIGLNGMKSLSVREQEGKEIIKNLCGEHAYVHLDPAFLLSAEKYIKLSKPSAYFPSTPFIIIDFIYEPSKAQIQEIMKFSDEQELPIVDINKLLVEGKIGVEEFLYAIQRARYIFTDSFHCTVFSIIFHRLFWVYTCNITSVASRINNLLRMFNLENRTYHNVESFQNTQIDYSTMDQVLPGEQKRSFAYLRSILGLSTHEPTEILPDNEMCCGCGACAAVCPKQCITMTANREGFLCPHVNNELCIHCGKCKSVCPIVNPVKVFEDSNAFSVVAKQDRIRQLSSSGGVFTVLAEKVINSGGIVFGAAFGNHFKVQHQYANTIESLSKLRTSKYVQSDTGDTYRQAKNFLDEGKRVFYTGTPCQIQGLKSFLRKDYSNLLTADVICHSVPSPLAWDKYVTYREKLHEKNVTNINFRNKVSGWHKYSILLQYEDGSLTSYKMEDDPFMRSFLEGTNSRLSCYKCPFRGEKRCSDLTIGDFWGIEKLSPKMDDNKGTSLVISHSLKGMKMLNSVFKAVNIEEADIYKALLYNYYVKNSPDQPASRKEYFDLMERGEIYV